MDNLTEHMKAWREGELSHSEMLGFLITALREVNGALRAEETHEADQGLKRMRGER